jgi:hypothetical protein
MLYQIKQIESLSKQTLTIVSNSGQGLVFNGNKVLVSLLMNSLLDLGTFEMNFSGKTAHNGAANGNKKLCKNPIPPPQYTIFNFTFRN